MLLYGPPGNGKTREIVKLIENSKKDKYRVIIIDSAVSFQDLEEFKTILEKDDNIFVIEEITERTEKNAEQLLNFLDGEMSWYNSYTIATTNYPEELPWNIIDRPGRFNLIKEVGNPTPEERSLYFKHMGIVDVEEAVKATDKLSLDYIINITNDSLMYNKTIPEVVKEYISRRKNMSNKFKSPMGLT